MGSSTENSSWGVTKNPWDLERIPGGSSGGSAAAVGGYEAFAALGSDTGGSIRQPAALCSCVGMKPTYGRVSRYGLVAFASSLDQIGTFTKTVEESAMLLEVIAGHDPRDNTSVDRPVPKYTQALHAGVKGLRLGVPKEYFIAGIDPEIEKAVRAAIDVYKSQGAEIVEVSLPHTKYAVAVYYIIATAECSANLARFDGVRYGKRAENPKDILDLYGRTRAEGFGPEVKRRIILGTYVLSSGYYDAYYNRAQKVRHLIGEDFRLAFEQCDALLTPTSPDRRVQDRRAHPGPAADVPRRHLHHRRQPRRHLRHLHPLRLHQQQAPHRPANHRPPLGRRMHVPRRARLRAGHGLAQGEASALNRVEDHDMPLTTFIE